MLKYVPENGQVIAIRFTCHPRTFKRLSEVIHNTCNCLVEENFIQLKTSLINICLGTTQN